MGFNLRQYLINEMENGRSAELVKLSGYADASALKKAIKKEDGDFEKFDGLVRMVHTLLPETKFEKMSEFARTLNPQKLTCRFMLEYASVYGLTELKQYLIEKLKNATNKESNDWAFVYEIDDKLAKNEIGGFEAINQLAQHSYTSTEMKVFSKIVQFYSFYDMRNIHMMNNLYEDVKNQIENIKKKFAKDTFYARLFLLECSVNLHNMNIGSLKEKLFLMESALEPIKSLAYLQIGNSYMLTSYDKAHKLFTQGMEIASEKYKVQFKRSINFNNILWDKFEGYLPDDDISNELFYYAKKGQKEQGICVLKKIDVESLSDHAKGFNYYYQGLLFNDKILFYKSVECFNKCGEKFYKKLPILELQKAGESEYVLNALSA
jgi:hypothetical protein